MVDLVPELLEAMNGHAGRIQRLMASTNRGNRLPTL